MARSSTTFQKGGIGNPKGRPKTVSAFQQACAAKTPEAVEELWKLASQAKPSMVKLEALKYIMNQAHGTPRQSVALEGSDGGPVDFWITLARVAEQGPGSADS